MQNAPALQDGFEEWEQTAIRREAEFYTASHPLRWHDADDLENAGLQAWWRQRGQYDSTHGASPLTYLKIVVRHAMADVVKLERTVGRGSGRTPASFDEPPESGRRRSLLASAAGNDRSIADAEHRLDFISAMSRLTERQQAQVRALLAGYSKTAIAAGLGIHRDTLHEDRRRIIEVCRREGLF